MSATADAIICKMLQLIHERISRHRKVGVHSQHFKRESGLFGLNVARYKSRMMVKPGIDMQGGIRKKNARPENADEIQ